MTKDSPSKPLWGPRYLIRFDDICPTMNWSIWNTIEKMLIDHDIKPILAVVPDNRDKKLMVDSPISDFWDRVRSWQARGWCICLHGYQHDYVNSEPGILGLSNKSEFAGLKYEEQYEKLRLGLEIFAREGVHADGWIAPSHSFDLSTVLALSELGIRTISDGLAWSPYRDSQGNVWVPQQFANMRPMPWGVWTFCYHHNYLSEDDLVHFRRRLAQLSSRMISMEEAVVMGYRAFSMTDNLIGWARHLASYFKKTE